MELWYTEKHTENTGITIKARDCLFRGRSKYQDLTILDSQEYGKILILDGIIMLTERDEFIYHEMISHVPLLSHPNPQRVLIIGGGDGGTVRETLKHSCVTQIDLVEIDEMVIEKCKEYFPAISSGFSSSKVSIHITDGIEFVKNCNDKYDVVIVDSSDPIGPGEGLFHLSFYQDIFHLLSGCGIMSAQTESPYMNKKLVIPIYKNLNKVFPLCSMYLAYIPTYPSGCWSFALCSKQSIALEHLNIEERYKQLKPVPKYYNPKIHQASFCLPNFIKEMLLDEDEF